MSAMIINNHDPGLINRKAILGEGIVQADCNFHICQNFNAKFGTPLMEQHFWGIANTQSEVVYTTRLLDLDAQRSEAANYLHGIDIQLWTAFFPGQ